jgi:addiction module HigA family antidote
MLMTKRKPASVGEILVDEFMEPMGLTQGVLAKAMGVPRKHVNELCNNRRAVTAPTALILARVFGNSPDFWLNVQRHSDLWKRCTRRASASGSNALAGQERLHEPSPPNVTLILEKRPPFGRKLPCRVGDPAAVGQFSPPLAIFGQPNPRYRRFGPCRA